MRNIQEESVDGVFDPCRGRESEGGVFFRPCRGFGWGVGVFRRLAPPANDLSSLRDWSGLLVTFWIDCTCLSFFRRILLFLLCELIF